MLSDKDRDRFWSKVVVLGEDECWEWTSAKRTGYGMFSLKIDDKRTTRGAHRISYEEKYGSTPLFVCHTCDNPPCVNPSHLFAGTHQDNMDDMYSKGRKERARIKESQPRKISKLSKEQVIEIYEQTKNWYHGKGQFLKKKYGVSHTTISLIRHRKYPGVSWPD